MRFLIQVILLCGFLFLVFQMGETNIFTILDIPSIIFILVLGHIMLISNFKSKEILKAYSIPFKKEINSEVLKTSELVMKALEKYIIFSGIIGFFIGVVMVLSRLDDLSTIGPALAVSLLTALYSVFFVAIIVNPILININKRKNLL